MSLRYPAKDLNKPSIMLLRSLALELGEMPERGSGGYGGIRLERERLSKILKEHINDARLSDWDRDMIRGL